MAKRKEQAKQPEYRYLGPDVPRVQYPSKKINFAPAQLTQESMAQLVQLYPALMVKYITTEPEGAPEDPPGDPGTD